MPQLGYWYEEERNKEEEEDVDDEDEMMLESDVETPVEFQPNPIKEEEICQNALLNFSSP